MLRISSEVNRAVEGSADTYIGPGLCVVPTANEERRDRSVTGISHVERSDDPFRDSNETKQQQQQQQQQQQHQQQQQQQQQQNTHYRTMTWWQCSMVMIADTISLGILSLPSVLAALGFVPGMTLIFGLGLLATYTGYTLGQFKIRYPHVYSMADAGEVLLGPVGREIFGAAQLILLVFICGSHVLAFSIMMNTLTNHGACSIVFTVVGALVQFFLSTPRTLKKVSYMSIASFISIIAAVMVTMIGVGTKEKFDEEGSIHATKASELAPAFVATTNIIFAYAGHVSFFSFMSELKKPESYTKALVLLQAVDTTMYLVVAAIIYAYGGDNVASPALSTAPPVVAKVAYGVAIPTIVISGVINGHVAAKYVFVRIYRDTGFLAEKSLKSILIWAGLLLSIWTLAWIIAEAIPVFNNLLAIISALFASWFTYGLSGVFWLYINQGQYTASWKKMVLTVLNVLIFCIGTTVCGLGLYASGTAIQASSGTNHGSFSCADNAIF